MRVQFTMMVDEIVLEYHETNDLEGLDGCRWLDEQARKENKSFYQKVFDVLYKHDLKERAEKWMKTK